MFKKFFLALFLFSFFSSAIAPNSDLAGSNRMLPAYPYVDSSGARQVSSYYQVFFDERGQATVVDRLELANLGSGPVDAVTLKIAGDSVSIRYALQLVPRETCINKCVEYKDQCNSFERICIVFNETSQQCEKTEQKCRGGYSQVCTNYREECSKSEVSDYNSDAVILKTTGGNGEYSVKLVEPILPGKKGVVVAYYKAFGYVKGDGLASRFDFPTARYGFDVDYVRVGVSVDNGLFVKGSTSRTDYAPLQKFDAAVSASAEKGGRLAASELSLIQNVRYGGELYKDKNNLGAEDVFHVQGQYADAEWKNNLGAIAAGLAALLAVVWALKKYLYGPLKNSKWLEGRKKQADYGRAVVVGGAAAIGLALVNTAITLILLVAMTGSYDSYRSRELLMLLVPLALWLACLVALVALLSKKSSLLEAAAAGVVFTLASVIAVPVLLAITLLVSNLLL